MFIQRLLKKRRAAVVEYTSPDALVDLALTAEDPTQRRDAVHRLASLGHLRALLSGEADASVREIAFGRYRSLLSGAEPSEIPLADRLAELAGAEDPRLLEHLALEGREPEVRRAALERVTDPRVLVACCLHDPLAANRATAAAGIHDRASLERLIREMGKKDKGVYRLARERIREIAAREQRPVQLRAQYLDLCERAERLGRLESWSQDRALLEHLDRQWSEIESEAEPEWRERWRETRGRFLAAYETHLEAHAAEYAARERRSARHAECQRLIEGAGALSSLTDETELRQGRERLASAWGGLGPWPEGEGQAEERRFAQALEGADAALALLVEHRQAGERLGRTIAKAERLLSDSKPLDAKQVRDLLAQGRGLAERVGPSSQADSFAERAARLELRLETQRQHAEQRLAELDGRLAELESAADEGELKRADPLYQSIQAGIELIRASGLRGTAVEAAATRLRHLASRVKELQQWRRWGADRHREALCAAVEALRTEDLPLAAVAERLHVLQTDWKELDGSGSPANHALWQRFHAAGEEVYARCRPHLEAEAAEREANRAARESVCVQLEEFLAQVDWEHIDWRRVMRAERETRQAWSTIGPCDGRSRKGLERRFHAAIKQLDGRLEAERSVNQAFKRGLIERVRALAERSDLDAAIEETKRLQREWRTTVPARQRDENRLWSEFRAACDAVFERRAAIHQAHRVELEQNLAAREAIVAEALALAEGAGDAASLLGASRGLEQRWRDLEYLAVPRQSAPGLVRGWQGARQRLRQRRAQLESEERRVELERLAARAALCERAERRVSALGPDEPLPQGEADALLAEWGALPPLADRSLQEDLQRRLNSALEAGTGLQFRTAFAEASRTNAERRRRLCLELEIAAGVESPPALAQERLKLQVARLAERLGEGEGEPLRGASQLLREWYLCGPAPLDAGLDARVARVREAMDVPQGADIEAA